MHGHTDWSAARASEIIAAEKGREGPLLPILHGFMEAFGYVPEPAVPLVAEALNLSRAEVHGVLTFYHDFRREPAGRHVVKLCRAESCQSAGCEELAAHLEDRLGISFGETTVDDMPGSSVWLCQSPTVQRQNHSKRRRKSWMTTRS